MLGKLESMMQENFFKEKRFHLLKLHLYQTGKAQNMPVVAGRLVEDVIQVFWMAIVACRAAAILDNLGNSSF